MKGARNRTADASGCRWVGLVRARARSTVHRDRHQSSVFTFASSPHHTHLHLCLPSQELPSTRALCRPSVLKVPYPRSPRVPFPSVSSRLVSFRFRPPTLWPAFPPFLAVSEGRIPDRPRSRVDTGRKSRHGLATEAGRAASASCWAGAELRRRAGPAGRSRCGLGCLLPGEFDC